MVAVISPGFLEGTLTASPSKSMMQRACALALLNPGTTNIQNPGNSADDIAALQIIAGLGAIVEHTADGISIRGATRIAGNHLNCGESGLSLRMFAPVAALSSGIITITGRGSLLKRPLTVLDEVFPKLGIEISSQDGFLPIRIKGPLIAKDILIDGSSSSQYLTGLLFAFARSASRPVVITVKGLVSKPYADMSVMMLQDFGYDVKHQDHIHFLIGEYGNSAREVSLTVEGDWSGAAFLLVAGAISGDIRVKGLDPFSIQADRAIIDVLQMAGADINLEGSCVLVKSKNLNSFTFDAVDSPDLFPPLVALASCCSGTSVIKGVSRLKNKESDRSVVLLDLCEQFGIVASVNGDEMHITGGQVRPAIVHSHNDHRIAMAAAVMGLRAPGEINIRDAEAVNKSYPGFYRDLQKLGVTLSLQQ